MADEFDNVVSDATTGDAAPETPETTPEPATDGGDDLGALKRAYERQKQENQKLKVQAKRAAILDQLEQGGIKPEELPTKLAELKTAEQQEQELARLRAEWESQSNQRERELTQRYESQVTALNQYLQAQTRQNRLADVFMAGGGNAKNELDAKDFQDLASRYVEFEDLPIKNDAGQVVGYESKIKEFRSPKGEPLWVDDEKQIGKSRPGELKDFLAKVKQGEYGIALQNLLPAYNQSSGSNISVTGGVGPQGQIVLKRSQLANISSLTPSELEQVKKNNYVLID